MIPRSFGIVDAYSFGIKTLGRNFFLVVGILGSLTILSVLLGLLVHHFIVPLEVVGVKEAHLTAEGFSGSFNYTIKPVSLSFSAMQALFFILACLAFAALWVLNRMFISRIGLNSSVHKVSTFQQLLDITPWFGTYLAVSFLISLVVTFGFILVIVPGFIFLMKYGFGDLIVLDSDLGPIEAMKRSNQLTFGHKWRLFGFYLLFAVAWALSSFIPLVGFVLVWTVFTFARAHVYRELVEIHNQDQAQFTAVKPGL